MARANELLGAAAPVPHRAKAALIGKPVQEQTTLVRRAILATARA